MKKSFQLPALSHVYQAMASKPVNVLKSTRPLVVAHRGGSLEAPENTVEALSLSVRCGSDWQEVDVALTADEEPVILHDDTLERTTGARGALSDWKLKDLKDLKAGDPAWDPEVLTAMRSNGRTSVPNFRGQYPQARIPTLADALAVPGAHLMLELKQTAKPAALAERVVSAIDAANARLRVAIASFDPEILREVHAQAPDLARIGLAEDMAQVHDMLFEGVNVLGVGVGLVKESAAVLPTHVALWAWTCYTVPMARQAVLDGADAVIADNPAELLRAYQEPKTDSSFSALRSLWSQTGLARNLSFAR